MSLLFDSSSFCHPHPANGESMIPWLGSLGSSYTEESPYLVVADGAQPRGSLGQNPSRKSHVSPSHSDKKGDAGTQLEPLNVQSSASPRDPNTTNSSSLFRILQTRFATITYLNHFNTLRWPIDALRASE